MSALTDLFSAMATKIRSKTGTQTTYTPPEMVSDGIDDVYAAGVAAGGTSTPITPSNSSPASMTSGTKYTPSTNGYAIASYDSVTPSSTPESVASGDIVKIGGSGVIVDAIPTPTSITPSNSSPVALTADTPVNPTSGGYAIASYDDVTPSSTAVSVAADDIVKMGGSGVIVDSVPTPTSITPSNVSPVSLTANTAVKPTASGYAIAAYSSVTPSNSSPVALTSGDIDKMGGNGYAIASYSTVTPSGIPTSVSRGDIVKIDDGYDNVIVDRSMMNEIKGSNTSPERMYGGTLAEIWGSDPTIITGYAIESYTPVTPSSTPTSISAGDMVQVKGSGTIVDAVTSITPSNSSPVSLSSGSIYKTGGSGYAIASYSSVTPSNAGDLVSSGDIVKFGGSGVVVDDIAGITPSNSSPVSLTANTAVKPTASGYAIASYRSITPSNSSPVTLSTDIYKSGASGYAIQSYRSISPSNSYPVSLDSGSIYKASADGYAISSYSSITPSNDNPILMTNNNIYKISGGGYAIAGYSNKTPSDTSPAWIVSGEILKASMSGYLVENAPINFSKPDVISFATMAGNSTRTIAVTKMPRYIIYGYSRTNANGYGGIFFIDVARDMYGYCTYGGSGNVSGTERTGTSDRVTSITSSSVTVAAGVSYELRSYVAIWY